MKIALVGNMNNIHFAFMRYLRDLGFNAYLFLYKNELAHFYPEYDTWEYEKWEEFIFQMDLQNGIGLKNLSPLFYRPKKIREVFGGFDIIIAHGFFPVYAKKANLKVDFFLPYSLGIEFLCVPNENIKLYVLFSLMRRLQLSALNSHTKKIITLDFTKENLKNFKYLRHEPTIMGLPMVYNQEVPDESKVHHLATWVNKLEVYELVVFSHVSHIWKNIPSDWLLNAKRNDLLIEGFAKYLNRTNQRSRSVLVFLDYGSDVDESKKLIRSFGIDDNVIWLPQMSRKEIMYLLDFVDIGGGELGGCVWGGTGWEFMAKGVPFFQYVKLEQDEFKRKTGQQFPNILNTDSPDKIANYLLDFEINRNKYQEMGQSLKSWFDQNAGIELVRRYTKMFQSAT